MRAFGFYHTTTLALSTSEPAGDQPESDAPAWTEDRARAWRTWREAGSGVATNNLPSTLPVTRPTSRGPWLERLLNGSRTASA